MPRVTEILNKSPLGLVPFPSELLWGPGRSSLGQAVLPGLVLQLIPGFLTISFLRWSMDGSTGVSSRLFPPG